MNKATVHYKTSGGEQKTIESEFSEDFDICVILARMIMEVPESRLIKSISINKVGHDILLHQSSIDKNVLGVSNGDVVKSFRGIPVEVTQ